MGSGFALSEVTLSGGKVLTPGVAFKAGLKDQRLFFKQGGPYELQVDCASRTNIVMFDVHERRGCLMDGASALLHMCRTWLSHPKAPPLKRGWPHIPLHEFVHLEELQCREKSAYDVLVNAGNRKIVLYPGTT